MVQWSKSSCIRPGGWWFESRAGCHLFWMIDENETSQRLENKTNEGGLAGTRAKQARAGEPSKAGGDTI